MNPEPTLMWRSDCDKSISVRCESIVIWCNGVFCTVISPASGRGAALLYNRFYQRQRNHLTDMIYQPPDRQYCGGLTFFIKGKNMKKIIPVALCALLPASVFATETPASTTNIFDNTRFFMEYGASIFSSAGTKTKLDSQTLSDIDTTSINAGTSLSVGADFDGIQLAFTPSYSDQEDTSIFDLGLKLDIPFMDTKLQPYISLSAGIGFVSIDSLDVDNEIGLGYGIGAGVKYTFNDNMYVKVGLEYAGASFSVDVYGYDADISASGFGLTTGLGYRF